MLWNIALGIGPGSWGATGRKHPETRAYQSYTTGQKHLPGIPGQKDHAISPQVSIMLENEIFLYIQMLRQRGRGKKKFSLLILSKLGQSSLFT